MFSTAKNIQKFTILGREERGREEIEVTCGRNRRVKGWNPQRGSESYIEKRRGRKEIEVTRRRKGESKGERQI